MNGPAPHSGTAGGERVYTAPDGVSIEYFFYPLEGSDRCVLFWPGMGVDARLYRFRPAEFNARGYSALAINPRNHGKSGGQISRSEAVADFLGIVASLKISGSRLDVIGHSAGCDAVLRLCDTGLAVGASSSYPPSSPPRLDRLDVPQRFDT
jgi:pimeloyl-ACP methyl ester carboxylesterase